MEPSTNLNQPTALVRFCGGIAGAAILFVIPFLLYGVSLGYPLLFLDDGIYFVGNPLLAEGRLEGIGKVWIGLHYGYSPITHLSIWLDVFLREQGVHGWWLARLQHLTWISVGILGVQRVLLIITKCPVTAWSVALLFALHPVCASTALWMALRRQALSFAFSMWAIACYLEAIKSTDGRRYLLYSSGAAVMCVCACLSRFNAIAICVLAPILSLLVQGRTWSKMWVAHVALVIPCIALVINTFVWADPNAFMSHRLGGSLAGTLWLDGEILARQLWHIVSPWQLAAYYGVTEVDGMSWKQGLYWFLVLLSVGGSLFLSGCRREALILWAAIAVSMGPTLNIFNQVIGMADHYLQPALPFFLLLGWRIVARFMALVKTSPASHWPPTIIGLAALYFASAAWPQNLHYSSSIAFGVQLAKISPTSGLMLANALMALSEYEEDDSELTHELAARSLGSSDLHRTTRHALYRALLIATQDLVRQGKSEEANALLTRTGSDLHPRAMFLLRALIIEGEGDRPRAIAMLARVCPYDEILINRIWVSRQGGAHLPIVTLSSVDGPGQSIFNIKNPLAPDADDAVWSQRILYGMARLAVLDGQYEKGARYALALVSINPQMLFGWEILHEAFIRNNQTHLAEACQVRLRILNADLDPNRSMR